MAGYYFVIWLMLAEFSCTTKYLDSKSMEYGVMSDDVTFEVGDIRAIYTRKVSRGLN